MSERYTEQDCRRYAQLLAEALGKQFGNCLEQVDGKNRWIEGCWDVEYNPVYGGARIIEISNENGGQRHPLLEPRLHPYEFCSAVTMARRAVEMVKQEKTVGEYYQDWREAYKKAYGRYPEAKP